MAPYTPDDIARESLRSMEVLRDAIDVLAAGGLDGQAVYIALTVWRLRIREGLKAALSADAFDNLEITAEEALERLRDKMPIHYIDVDGGQP